MFWTYCFRYTCAGFQHQLIAALLKSEVWVNRTFNCKINTHRRNGRIRNVTTPFSDVLSSDLPTDLDDLYLDNIHDVFPCKKHCTESTQNLNQYYSFTITLHNALYINYRDEIRIREIQANSHAQLSKYIHLK